MDVIADLALPVPSLLICEMLGVPAADRDRFTTWTAQATHALAGKMAPQEVQDRAANAAMSLGGYFTDLIEERRKDKGDDLISELIRAEEEGDRLSHSELVVQSIGLLIAGFETTIGLIGNGVAAFARHPDEAQKLRARPELVPNAVEECLRYEGPIGMTLRVLHEDASFGDRTIPADTEVWAMLWGANRDPAVFSGPRPLRRRARQRARPPGLRRRRAPLPRRAPRAHGGAGGDRHADRAHARIRRSTATRSSGARRCSACRAACR